MMRTCTLEIFGSFGANLAHQKVQKLPKNDLSASFWTHRSSLGDSSFEGENDLQIQKFKMSRKLDRNSFLMSYLVVNLAKVPCLEMVVTDPFLLDSTLDGYHRWFYVYIMYFFYH